MHSNQIYPMAEPDFLTLLHFFAKPFVYTERDGVFSTITPVIEPTSSYAKNLPAG